MAEREPHPGFVIRSEITPFGHATLAYLNGVLVTTTLYDGVTCIYIPPKLPFDEAHRYLRDKYTY